MTLFRKILHIMGVGAAITALVVVFTMVQAHSNMAGGRAAATNERRLEGGIRARVIDYAHRSATALSSVAGAFTDGKTAHPRLSAALPCGTAARRLLAHKPAAKSCIRPDMRLAVHIKPIPKPAQGVAPVRAVTSLQLTDVVARPTVTLSPPAPAEQAPVIQPLASLRSSADCSHGTLLTVVAHEDDDVLFMNPDVLNAAQAGQCLRTVYVTAGDAGQAQAYWLGREDGTKAAYAKMYNQPDEWQDQQVMLNGRTVEASTLKGVPQLGLIFLRLPDGNLHGDGFTATAQQSLGHLWDGSLAVMDTVDGTNAYSKDQLVATLLAVMNTDAPDHIHTQGLALTADGDHSDHIAVGHFTKLAATDYDKLSVITQYAGYPERLLLPNISADDVAMKRQLFFAYAPYDGAVCQDEQECAATDSYSNYLTRQFEADVPLMAPPVVATAP